MTNLFNQQKVVLGTWSCGSGIFREDHIFGSYISDEDLKSVFEQASRLAS